MNKLATLLILLCVPLFLLGCADKREKLPERVKQVWDAKVKDDLETFYDATSPAFKKQLTKMQFIRRANMRIKDYAIQSIEFENDENAVVKVEYTTVYMGFDFVFTSSNDWIYHNGKWFVDLVYAPLPMMPANNQTKE